MSNGITYQTPSGKVVADLVEKIEDVLEGEPTVNVYAACLVLAILSQKPDVTTTRLQETVKLTSEALMATLLAEDAPVVS